MKNSFLLWQLLTLVALAAPTLYLVYSWDALPAQVPTHFATDGKPNGYTSRTSMWLLTLGLPLGIFLFLTLLPRFDPKRRLDADSANFQKLRLALVTTLGSIAGYTLYTATHPGAEVGRGLVVLLGLFFAFMGNYLTTVQPNYFVGIRTPWTLESPTVWARTHRVGGIVFCVVGLLAAGLALVVPSSWTQLILVIPILGTAAFSYIYSYAVFQREERLGKQL